MTVPYTDESRVKTITSADSPYTPTGWDRLILMNCAGGAITVTLPASSDQTNQRLDFKKIDTTANAATITPSGAETVDGVAASKTLAFQWRGLGLTCVSGGWISNYEPSRLPPGYMTGLAPVWVSVTQVRIAPGQARDSTDALDITLSAADSAVITTAGDRDFTPGVNQWVYVHVIADSSGANATSGSTST